MKEYIDKAAVKAELERRKIPFKKDIDDGVYPTYLCALMDFEDFIDTLEVKEVDLKLENETNNPKITVGTKIRSKVNPDVILSIISDDCHEDEFECSNGSVLSLKQIEKYYDVYIEEK